MSEELKPCPFCGGKARMHVAFASGGEHSVGVYVECLECRSWSGTKWGDGAQEKAAEGWNRRAERTCNVESSHVEQEIGDYSYLEVELSCGHAFTWDDGTPPDYCPNCGAKVIE